MSNTAEIKNIYISNLCNGSLTVSADITEDNDIVEDLDAKSSSVEFHMTDSAITIEGGETTTYDFHENSSLSDNTAINLKYIPAFFSGGTIRVDAIVLTTDDADDKVDITFDVLMYIRDTMRPSWYPYSLELADDTTMADPLVGIVTSPNANVYVDSLSQNTTLSTYFSLGSWIGFRPVVNQWPPDLDQIHMSCLPSVSFRITCKNNLEDSVTLSSLTVLFTINYQTNATLCNLGNKKSTDFCQLYPGPKGLTDPCKLWAIVDGYEGGTLHPTPEIIKVFGYFYSDTDDVQTAVTVVLKPVADTGGTNFPPVVYASEDDVLTVADNTRMIKKGFYGGEYAWVITPAVICQGSEFKDIDVACIRQVNLGTEEEPDMVEEPCNFSDPDAEFLVSVKLRDDIDEVTIDDGITQEEFDAAIAVMKFFNVDTEYVSYDYENSVASMRVLRENIDSTFYDSLAGNLKDFVVLESSRGDVEPFVLIQINSWPTPIPIYSNRPIQFQESLTRCTDGVRTRDVWFYGEKGKEGAISNSILLTSSEKRYRVKMKVTYSKYRNMYVHNEVSTT